MILKERHCKRPYLIVKFLGYKIIYQVMNILKKDIPNCDVTDKQAERFKLLILS